MKKQQNKQYLQEVKRSLNTDSDESSSTEKVTRANVIDKVEDYEGHQLDTETYTYKEPEQDENGDWGFSILDKMEIQLAHISLLLTAQ